MLNARQREWVQGWWPVCGIIPPLITFVLNALVGALHGDYDPLREYASALAAHGQPYAAILSGWWIAFPFCFLPFPIALYQATRTNPLAWTAPTLLALFAVAVGFSGIFRCAPGCRGHSFSNLAHLAASTISSAMLAPSPLFFWWTIHNDPRWRCHRSFSLVMQALGTLAGFGMMLAILQIIPLRGLIERMFWCVYYVWVLIIALRLMRLGRPARMELAHTQATP
jgi:hypothetical protein